MHYDGAHYRQLGSIWGNVKSLFCTMIGLGNDFLRTDSRFFEVHPLVSHLRCSKLQG